MSLTFDREAVVEVPFFVYNREKIPPKVSASPGVEERVRVSDQNQPVPCTREKDVEALGGMHEPYVTLGIRPCQAGDDDLALFALVVIYWAQVTIRRTSYLMKIIPMVANRIPGR